MGGSVTINRVMNPPHTLNNMSSKVAGMGFLSYFCQILIAEVSGQWVNLFTKIKVNAGGKLRKIGI